MYTERIWFWVLVVAILLTSLFVITVRHQHRISYLDYHTQVKERDALNDEWGQLLIEENLWSSSQRLEKDAGEQLKMRAPKDSEVIIVNGEDANVGVEVAYGAR